MKAEHNRPPGLLQQLEIPLWKLEHLTMDFITGLPSLGGKDGIWVIVDRLTKLTHFIPISMQSSMETFTKLHIDKIITLHGYPLSIVSDRDSRFVGRFWESLQKGLGTTLHFSLAYHPQTDG